MAQAVTSPALSFISVDALPINTGKRVERAITPTSDPLSEAGAQVQPKAVELAPATSSRASSSTISDPSSITATLFNGNYENAGDISLTDIQKNNKHYQIRKTGSESWVSADSEAGAELLSAAITSGQSSFLQA